MEVETRKEKALAAAKLLGRSVVEKERGARERRWSVECKLSVIRATV